MALKETLIGAAAGLVLGVGSSMIANVWWSRMTSEFSGTLQKIDRSREEISTPGTIEQRPRREF
jgi:hypothetical protein